MTITTHTTTTSPPPVHTLNNWLPSGGRTPLFALEQALKAYADNVTEVNRLRSSEEMAQEALLAKRAFVYNAGIEGKNEAERSAFLALHTNNEARDASRAAVTLRMATDLLSVARERLTLEKIRSRAIIALTCNDSDDTDTTREI